MCFLRPEQVMVFSINNSFWYNLVPNPLVYDQDSKYLAAYNLHKLKDEKK